MKRSREVKFNPTIRVFRDLQGEETGGWRISYMLRQGGPRIVNVPESLALTLIQAQRKGAIEDLLADDVIRYLEQIQILTDSVPPRPSFSNLLDASWPAQLPECDDDELEISETFSLECRAGGCVNLVEAAPWGIAARYELSQEQLDAFLAFVEGSHVDPQLMRIFRSIGCFVTDQQSDRSAEKRKIQLEDWKAGFRTRGWAVVENVVSPFELHSLLQYCDAVENRGYLDGDHGIDGKNRSHVFDDPELRLIHLRFADLISELTGGRYVPTYSFLAFYKEGGRLPLHRDKPHCMVTASLCIKASDHVAENWPLNLQLETSEDLSLYWPPGAATIFDGRRLRHSRPPLMRDEQATYLVMHCQSEA